MIICSGCRKEMICTKNGIVSAFTDSGHCYIGDQFTCRECGSSTVVTNRDSYESPDIFEKMESKEEGIDYLDMRPKELDYVG